MSAGKGLPPAANPHLIGHLRAEGRVLEALASGRVHHAWLLSGRQGIGKATFAWRFARFLLAHGEGPPPAAQSLHVEESHPAFRRVAAGSHPDLLVLQRPLDAKTKRRRAVIPVEEARRAVSFIGRTAAEGGWRAVIVDAAEEMNAAAANALLKALEEPPERCVFLLVSHSPGRLLPTIRSRCLHLPLRPLDAAQVREALALTGAGQEDEAALERAVALCGGSPGRALALAGSRAAELFSRFRDMAAGTPPFDHALTMTIASGLSGIANREDFDLFVSLLEEWLQRNARHAALSGHAGTAALWAELAARLAREHARAESFNLDRRQMLGALFSAIGKALAAQPANMS